MPNVETATSEESREKIYLDLPVQLDPELIREFPEELSKEFQVIPLSRSGRNTLVLASAGELSRKQLKDLKKRFDGSVHLVPLSSASFEDLWERVLRGGSPQETEVSSLEGEPGPDPVRASEELPSGSVEGQGPDAGPALVSSFPPEAPQLEQEPRDLSTILVDLGLLSQEELQEILKNLEESVERQYLDPTPYIGARVLRLMPEKMAEEHQVLPLAQVEGDLMVGADRYLDAPLVAEIRQATGLMPKIQLVQPEQLKSAIKDCYERRRHLKASEMRLGDYLVAHGYIDASQLEKVLKEQESTEEKLGELLVRKGLVPEDVTHMYLAERLGYEFRRFSTGEIDLELSKMVSQRFAERNLVLPLMVSQETKDLEVAMAEPYDLKVVDTLKNLVGQHGYRLRLVLSSPSNIKEGVSYLYNFQGLVEDEVELETVAAEPEPDRRDLVLKEDLPKIRRIINHVLYRAVIEEASDVHIENLEKRVRVRFRMDGLLQERKTSITKDNIRSVISVFKVDSGLDITEQRRSQDGVFKMSIGKDRFVDFRINLHSVEFGQDAVIRILDTSKNLLPLEGLGCPPRMLERYLQLVENPQGLILFTGPTGSGKSTTLYSTLAHLNSPEKKIVTAEDPVEYYLNGVCQYKVNEAIGNTFAEYARRFLRKDPDIILIGEIRDEQTAEACLRAAMTGHLVFSTLHTNDSVGALERLKNLRINSETVAEALLAVVSQRLARRTCSKCRQPYRPDPSLFPLFFPDGVPSQMTFMNGSGCAACDYLGYKGRVGLYEYWELSPETVVAISENEGNIRALSKRTGLMPVVADGLAKVQQGITTLEELRRTVPLDQIRMHLRPSAEDGAKKPLARAVGRKSGL